MILCDKSIRCLCLVDGRKDNTPPLITPFSEAVSGSGRVSYGLTHAGYDARLANEIKVFINTGEIVDPKMFKDGEYCKKVFHDIVADDFYTIPAHSYILGRTHEWFNIPLHLKGHCVGKSTFARCGLIVNVTPLEPGWSGYLTIEIANTNPCPAKVYIMEGICQIEFHRLDAVPEASYTGKKYHNQTGVTPARVL